MSEHANEYLLKNLPMIDVLVLDEADRMVADGHFKEMRDILAHIYTKRVEVKASRKTKKAGEDEGVKPKKSKIFEEAINEKEFTIGNTVTKKGVDIDMSNIKDLYDEGEMLEDIGDELVLSDEEDEEGEGKKKKTKKKRLDKQLFDKL